MTTKTRKEFTKQLVRKQKTIEIMKTKMNRLVAIAIFSFIFLAGSVNAKGTEISASSLKNIEEATLELENWMVNDDLWNTAEMAYYVNESENNLNVENWMISENTGNSNSIFFMEAEQENNLTLETWMTGVWNKAEIMETETEIEIETEAWMTNNMIW